MRPPHAFHQAVRHQRAGGDHGLHHAVINEVGDDQSLLGHRHGAGQRHHHETIFVARHGFQHLSALAHLPSGKRGVAHGTDQVIHGAGLRQIERLQRNQFVGNGIVQYAIQAFAVTLVLLVTHHSPRR